MTKKVHELAKEMNITSKELLEKAHQLGIDVKSHMSALSDADIDKIANVFYNKFKKSVLSDMLPL